MPPLCGLVISRPPPAYGTSCSWGEQDRGVTATKITGWLQDWSRVQNIKHMSVPESRFGKSKMTDQKAVKPKFQSNSLTARCECETDGQRQASSFVYYNPYILDMLSSMDLRQSHTSMNTKFLQDQRGMRHPRRKHVQDWICREKSQR